MASSQLSTKRMVVPAALKIVRLKPTRKYALLGRLAHDVGWKYQAITATLEEERRRSSSATPRKRHWSSRRERMSRSNVARFLRPNIRTFISSGCRQACCPTRLRGQAALEKLKVFDSIPPPYDKRKRMIVPAALKIVRLKPTRKYALLGRLAHESAGSTRPSQPPWRRKRRLCYCKKKTLVKLTKVAEKNVEGKIAAYTALLKQYGVLV
ncbi:60S ribosomal protein L13a-like [Hippoglossus hippoglossus]|uniref:60S ribosomal protein L13a-like n=1 Tax=Hippoglossus hippoglossus TaxID=8267 RepID=UPI00148C3973|nr:60S ribosomal protein L13a-like [Hippoglossus hippoglossus]